MSEWELGVVGSEWEGGSERQRERESERRQKERTHNSSASICGKCLLAASTALLSSGNHKCVDWWPCFPCRTQVCHQPRFSFDFTNIGFPWRGQKSPSCEDDPHAGANID